MAKTTKGNITNRSLEKTRLDRTESAKACIFTMRGQRAMLDGDLAKLYGVTTKRLNEQLRRNRQRFPEDFAFRLTLQEARDLHRLRSQNATLKRGQHVKHAPHVFTEHGAIMLASVLNSKVAVQASVHVVRAFVQMRAALLEYANLSLRIDALEEEYDENFRKVFSAIRALITTPAKTQKQIGFVSVKKASSN